tara:strand:+ start:3292 stop:3426 length:135 start_codon:yes stop_codon:yes gene_type:complete
MSLAEHYYLIIITLILYEIAAELDALDREFVNMENIMEELYHHD